MRKTFMFGTTAIGWTPFNLLLIRSWLSLLRKLSRILSIFHLIISAPNFCIKSIQLNLLESWLKSKETILLLMACRNSNYSLSFKLLKLLFSLTRTSRLLGVIITGCWGNWCLLLLWGQFKMKEKFNCLQIWRSAILMDWLKEKRYLWKAIQDSCYLIHGVSMLRQSK